MPLHDRALLGRHVEVEGEPWILRIADREHASFLHGRGELEVISIDNQIHRSRQGDDDGNSTQPQSTVLTAATGLGGLVVTENDKYEAPVSVLPNTVSGWPVSTSVLRPLRMRVQPPETFAAVFSAPSSRSWMTVSFE